MTMVLRTELQTNVECVFNEYIKQDCTKIRPYDSSK